MRLYRFVEKFVVVGVVGALGLGCSSSSNRSPEITGNWIESGSLVLARPLPAVTSPQAGSALGFWSWYPAYAAAEQAALVVDRNAKTLVLDSGSGEVVSIDQVDVPPSIPAGNYQVLHKQQNPLWYAPDSYFKARNLPVPSQGDRSRYRRGALGEYAVFINQETPIHCGAVSSEEVGGIRLSGDDLARIYFTIQVGDSIEIK